jgi:alkylation response protein AidB-like acyl-CoA dehydrogenase
MIKNIGTLDDYRCEVRAWLAQNLVRTPTGCRADRVRGELPSPEHLGTQRKLQRDLFDAGYAGISWPVEYGGQGLTEEHQRVFDEEAADYDLPNFGPLQNTTFGVCAPTILAHGSDQFRRQHLPAILAGEELWAQFFSEPDAGSDLAAVRTRAVPDGDRWILHGSKIWSSGAMIADYGMCLARTDGSLPKHQGLTWFAIPTSAAGLTIRPIREASGGEEFCEEFFDAVTVADSQRIGDVNAGWTVATTMLGFERSATGRKLAAQLGGPPGNLPADLVELADRRGMLADGPTRQQIARAHVNEYIHRQLTARIFGLITNGGPAALTSYVKLADGVTNATRAQITLEVADGSAVAWSDDDAQGRTAAMRYLDARVKTIAGGTNEMQRNGIGERILGLPREPNFDHGKPFDEIIRQSTGQS